MLQRGARTSAAREAEKGYEEFHAGSGEGAWKFTILRASVRRCRRMKDVVLKLLTTEPAPLPTGDLAVQERRLEGVAYFSLQRFPEAEEKLGEAERLCG